MIYTKLFFRRIVLSFIISLLIFGFGNFAGLVQAQISENGNSTNKERLIFVEPQLTNRGAPGRRTGGGKRGDSAANQCPSLDENEAVITALVPAVKQTNTSIVNPLDLVRGVTIKDRPTFWFYVSYPSRLNAEFVVQEKEGRETKNIYKKLLQLPGKKSFVSISIPSDPQIKPLEIGKDYRWNFSIICNPNERSEDIFVNGGVQRVSSPTVSDRLDTTNPRSLIVFYAKNGIWYEAITLLGNSYFKNPSDRQTATDWADLLGSVGLDNIAQEGVVDRYSPEN
ncbi:DUF928 domain-containing protein [Argonema antarcticum]|uniref:DUF928 domain-containing protein n=1 Tax=Argonema antarcticum TaxID=2942763 RepID=UPI0020127266|nr:DUF928 domain-containing protein [Argonema antarcticum]MCL1472881.1 DUF928 domain-containing protein [Argonema antarcticum A004/B2]